MLLEAKRCWSDEVERTDMLTRAATIFEDAAIDYPGNAYILGNQAYCAHLLGCARDDVATRIDHALRIGRQSIYDATIGDLKLHPVTNIDDAFHALICEVWDELK
ncbi:hypothetical protein D3C85_1401890 [compost metagenome]